MLTREEQRAPSPLGSCTKRWKRCGSKFLDSCSEDSAESDDELHDQGANDGDGVQKRRRSTDGRASATHLHQRRRRSTATPMRRRSSTDSFTSSGSRGSTPGTPEQDGDRESTPRPRSPQRGSTARRDSEHVPGSATPMRRISVLSAFTQDAGDLLVVRGGLLDEIVSAQQNGGEESADAPTDLASARDLVVVLTSQLEDALVTVAELQSSARAHALRIVRVASLERALERAHRAQQGLLERIAVHRAAARVGAALVAEAEPTFDVRGILAFRRGISGDLEARVQWQSGERTWEPARNIYDTQAFEDIVLKAAAE